MGRVDGEGDEGYQGVGKHLKKQLKYDRLSRGQIASSREGSGRFMLASAVDRNRSTMKQPKEEKVEMDSEMNAMLDWTVLVFNNVCCYFDGYGLSMFCLNRGSNAGVDGLMRMFFGRMHVMNVSIMEMCLCKPCIYALAYYCAVELSQMTRLKLAGAMQMHAGRWGR